MIALDEDALICDFAETYRVLDYEQLPVVRAATLAAGLRDDSRIKLKINGLKVSVETLLLARIADSSAINVYAKTKDAKTGKNPPKSMVSILMGTDATDEVEKFETAEDFKAEWERINGN